MSLENKKTPETVTFESFFKHNLRLFFYDPINPYLLYLRPLAKGWPMTRGQIIRQFGHVSLLYVVVGQLTQIILGYINTGDVITACESLAYSIIGTICIFVCWTIQTRTKDMYEIIMELEEIYPKDKDVLEKINAREIFVPLEIIMVIFRTCYYVTLGFKYAAPLIETLIGYLDIGHLDLRLPLHVWYPFDPHRPVLIVVVFIYELWGAFMSTTPMPIVTSLLGGITSAICVQFRLLNWELENLRPDRNGKNTEALIKLIKRHTLLIDKSGQIEEMFSVFLLGNYILCSLGLSLFMFVTIFSDKQAVVIEYIGCCTCFIFYISIVSMFGHTYMENVGVPGRITN